jgi:SGNH domain (fused to AT3 domains)
MSRSAPALALVVGVLCAVSTLSAGAADGQVIARANHGSTPAPAVSTPILVKAVGHTTPLPDPARDPLHVYLGNVRPAPAHAESDEPVVYHNGCHVYTRAGTFAHFCVYGDKHAKKTVVLFGDSHVAQWFPAFDAAARSEHVKLLYITKTSCPAQSVSVRVWERDIPYGACDVWRKHALTLINKLKHVDLIVLGGYAHHQITKRYTNTRINNPTARATAWRGGTRRTVQALRGVADEIVILRDTPLMRLNSAPCLISTRGDNRACQTSYTRASAALLWQSEEEVASEYAHVTTADFTSAFCTASRCRPVTDTRVLRWRDQSHMSVTFARLLAPRVRLLIRHALAGKLGE